MTTKGTLNPAEPHPAAFSAYDYLSRIPYEDLIIWQESFASNAIEGNRLAEVCSETLHRFLIGQPVSDRYMLGLVWTIKIGVEDA